MLPDLSPAGREMNLHTDQCLDCFWFSVVIALKREDPLQPLLLLQWLMRSDRIFPGKIEMLDVKQKKKCFLTFSATVLAFDNISNLLRYPSALLIDCHVALGDGETSSSTTHL